MRSGKFFNSFSAQFIAITQGGNKGTCVNILDQFGFSYSFYRKSNSNQTWRCNQRKRFDCHVFIKTVDDDIVSQTNVHCHKPKKLHNGVFVNFWDDVVQRYFTKIAGPLRDSPVVLGTQSLE